MKRLAPFLFLCILACGLPRDPDGTLDRVRGGVLRVGFSENHPWVTDSSGVERRMVMELASQLGARVEFVSGSESKLLEEVHGRRLDLMIAGLTGDGSWTTKAAPTKSFYTDPAGLKQHVWAAPPGENAWLVTLEKFLRSKRPEIPRMLADEQR